MPDFVLFLRGDRFMEEPRTPAEQEAHFRKFVDWAEKLKKDGRLRAVERLEGTDGRTVRRQGAGLVVDGPFAEGKEAVLGFFLVEADDLAHAVRLAGECPCVETGGNVEVRPCGFFPKP